MVTRPSEPHEVFCRGSFFQEMFGRAHCVPGLVMVARSSKKPESLPLSGTCIPEEMEEINWSKLMRLGTGGISRFLRRSSLEVG